MPPRKAVTKAGSRVGIEAVMAPIPNRNEAWSAIAIQKAEGLQLESRVRVDEALIYYGRL